MAQFCKYCGSKIDLTTGECPECTQHKERSSVYQEDIQPPVKHKADKTKNKEKDKKSLMIIAILLFIIGIGILIAVAILNSSKINLPDSYKEIVEEYQRAISKDKNTSGKHLNERLLKDANGKDFEMYYSLYDINEDDVDEFIVGGKEKGNKDVKTYDVFTMDGDNNSVQLFDTNSFEGNTDIDIYGEIIKVTNETDDIPKKIIYYELPQNSTEADKKEEYRSEDDAYYEVTDDVEKEITKEEFEEADKKYEGQKTDFDWVEITPEEGNGDKDEKVLSPESAVKIYMMNEAVWKYDADYPPMQGYGYCLLDLDFDGILELIVSINDGSGRYSYNSYYKINPNTQTVEEFESLEKDEEGIDYYYLGDKETKLLKNTASGQLFYYCNDYLNEMVSAYATTSYKVYMDSGKVKTDAVCGEYHCGAGAQGNTDEINVYYNYQDGDYAEISGAEFEKKKTEFFKDNTDVNLSWGNISGDEFNNLPSDQKEKRLLEEYRKFSYDGFSFDNLSTYDIEFEKPKQPSGEVATYLEYLKNGGMEKCIGESSDSIYTVESCMIDANDDGVSELLMRIGVDPIDIATDPEWMSHYYLLLSIENGVVTKKLLTYDHCEVGGYELLTIKYDTTLKKHVIHYAYMASDGSPGTLESEKAYAYDGKTLTPYASNAMVLEEDNITMSYKVNDKSASKAEYEKSKTRFVEPTDSRYKVVKGTYSNPLGM